jgi:hypothetical protein
LEQLWVTIMNVRFETKRAKGRGVLFGRAVAVMIQRTSLHCIAAAVLFGGVLCASSVEAGLVSFSDIIQTPQTPGDVADLYGDPDTSVPNTLNFPHPNSFAATAFGAGGVDATDGLLTFSVTADPGTWATGISLTETGSWSLIPLPTLNAVGVRGLGWVDITEVDGNPVVPPTRMPFSFSEDYGAADTPPDTALWTSGFVMDFAAVIGNVTGFDVTMDNRLFALSEGGFSFIDKKQITFTVPTVMGNVIPEPSSILLAMMGLMGFVTCGSRRRLKRRLAA